MRFTSSRLPRRRLCLTVFKHQPQWGCELDSYKTLWLMALFLDLLLLRLLLLLLLLLLEAGGSQWKRRCVPLLYWS